MKVCGFHSIAVEIVVNIFTFISFQDIFYNKMPSVSYELHNTLNCLIKNIKQENCLKINSLNYVNHRITLKNSSIFIFKTNIHTPIKKRLFAILDKQIENSCFFIVNPYTNNISLLLKLCSNRILLIFNKLNKSETKNCDLVEIIPFERTVVFNKL